MLIENCYDTGDVVLNYAACSGQGTSLVMLHGLPGCWQEFEPILAPLASRWPLYALDMRGQGQSSHTERYLPQDYIADLIAFIKHISEPVVLYGMSAGGLVSLAAAAECQHKVRGVIVGDSPVDLGALATWMESPGFAVHFSALRDLIAAKLPIEDVATALGNLPAQHPETKDLVTNKDIPGHDALYLRSWAATLQPMDPQVLDYHATGRGTEYLASVDMVATLKAITCPVLLLGADPARGAMLTPAIAEWVNELCPSAIFRQLSGQGHSLGLSTWDTAQLLSAVTGFLDSVLL